MGVPKVPTVRMPLDRHHSHHGCPSLHTQKLPHAQGPRLLLSPAARWTRGFLGTAIAILCSYTKDEHLHAYHWEQRKVLAGCKSVGWVLIFSLSPPCRAPEL